MLDAQGHVAEASGMNVFAVTNGTLKTPPPYAGILRGVTRDAVIELAREATYGIEEVPLNRYDLYTADEVFFTGTAAEIVGVSKLDARVIGAGVPGPVTKELSKRFKARSEEHTSELQSQSNLVCRLLLEKKKKKKI